MERGSSKHSPAMDEDLARATESLTRGRPTGSRASEWRDPEPAGEDQPDPSEFPSGAYRAEAEPSLTTDELEARSDFGRWIPRSVLPAKPDQLVRAADEVDAPAEVLAELQSLPADRTYTTVYEIWEALGHRNEPGAATGRGDAGAEEQPG